MLAVLFFALAAGPQAAPNPLASYVGQKLILRYYGDSGYTRVRARDLDHPRGQCDVAVEVKSADWAPGEAHFRLEPIGHLVLKGVATSCKNSYNEIILAVTELQDVAKDLARVLQAPDEYLEASGVSIGNSPETGDARLTLPRVVLRVNPAYTEAARKAKVSATVQVGVTITADGRVRDARVVQGPGMGLNERALRAVALWRFEPARKEGKPFSTPAAIEITFRML